MLQKQNQEQAAREAVRKTVKNAAPLFSKETSQRFFRARMERESIEKLVEFAREGDKDAAEILVNRGRVARSTRAKVPDCFHEFIWEWFLDGPPKAKSGSSPKDTELRYQTIALLVDIVNRDYGFPEYRNVEHRGKKTGAMSACLLVAEELDLDERWVEEIWAERKEMIRRRRSPC
jgi:hypothetical protein